MGLNIGSTAISDLKLGSTQVDKVYLGANQIWSKSSPTIRALKFSGPEAQTIHVQSSTLGDISPNFEYSTDGGATWTTWSDVTQNISFGNGTDLYLRGMNTILADSNTTNRVNFVFSTFIGNNYVDCTGNIMHLFDYTQDLTSFPSPTTPGGLYLMFGGATCLRTAPDLPATVIPDMAYYRMFYVCQNLQSCPSLPATILTNSCYKEMFRGCNNLETISALSATTLATDCYQGMFRSCSKIKMSLTQDSEYANEYIFGADPSGKANSMFGGTGGTFTGAPTQTTYYTSNTIIT